MVLPADSSFIHPANEKGKQTEGNSVGKQAGKMSCLKMNSPPFCSVYWFFCFCKRAKRKKEKKGSFLRY